MTAGELREALANIPADWPVLHGELNDGTWSWSTPYRVTPDEDRVIIDMETFG